MPDPASERRGGELFAKVERKQGKDGAGLRGTLQRSELDTHTAHRWQVMA